MKINVWYGLSLRVIALFVTAMIVSFSPELFRGLFGDTLIIENEYGHKYGGGMIDTDWDWGYRHYLYFIMCFALFAIQAVRLGKWIDKYGKDFKP
jgi:hypothetical protein